MLRRIAVTFVIALSSALTGFPAGGPLAVDDALACSIFVPCSFSVSVSPAGSGTVSGSAAGTGISTSSFQLVPFIILASYNVSLSASPASGWAFGGWSGFCGGVGGCAYATTVSSTVAASFRPSLTVTTTGQGTVSGTGISCPSDCSEIFSVGQSVSLTATPAANWKFDGWSGACSGTGACNLSMSLPRTVSAVFSRIKHTVAVTKVGAGKVISSPSGIDCGPTCSGVFNQGDPLTLTATPDDGREFVGWSGSCTGSNPVCSLTISVAIATVATFRDVPIRLTVTRTGDGSVTSQPAGISCGSTCGFDFLKNSTVTLTAAPASGAFFAGWGGACSGGALTCTVKLDAAKTATAAFRTPALTLSALAFNVRWSRSQATGSLDVAGTTTDGAEILVTLATAAPLPLTLSSGAFKISVPMPAGLLPGPQHVVITAVSHGINLPPTDRQVVLKGPPEGVVSEVTFSSTENGPPVDKYPQGAKELFARFRFAAPPQRVCKQKRIRNKKTKKVRVKRVCTARQITVTWFRPNGEAAGAPVKKAFSAVVTTFVRSNVVLPSGRWRVELRAGRVLVRDAEVVVG